MSATKPSIFSRVDLVAPVKKLKDGIILTAALKPALPPLPSRAPRQFDRRRITVSVHRFMVHAVSWSVAMTFVSGFTALVFLQADWDIPCFFKCIPIQEPAPLFIAACHSLFGLVSFLVWDLRAWYYLPREGMYNPSAVEELRMYRIVLLIVLMALGVGNSFLPASALDWFFLLIATGFLIVEVASHSVLTSVINDHNVD